MSKAVLASCDRPIPWTHERRRHVRWLGLTLAIAGSLGGGCANPFPLATKERLPDSVLRPQSSSSAKISTSNSDTPNATHRPVAAPERDVALLPVLPDKPPADGPAAESVSVLKESETVTPLPRRLLENTPSAKPPAPNPIEPPSSTRQISRLARELEGVAPEKVDEFLSEARKAAVSGQVDETMAVWRASLEHWQRAPRRAASGQPVVGTNPVDETAAAPVATRPTSRTHSAEVGRLATLVDDPKAADPAEPIVRLRHSANPAKPTDTEKSPERPPVPLDDRLRQFASDLRGNGKDPPAPSLKQQVLVRLVELLAGESSADAKKLTGVDETENRFWTSLFQAVDSSLDTATIPRKEARAARAIDRLEDATAALRESADLVISTPLLCEEVTAFGNYVEYPKYEFRAGQGMVVYFEVRNFASTEGKDGYRTRMRATLELTDAQGVRRHRSQHDYKDDVSRSRRHDFFCVIGFRLPADLPAGEYSLRISANDKTTDKIAEKQTRLVVR